MKEGRKQKTIIDAEELKKSCAARSKPPPDYDPLNVFEDSPVYREPQVKDADAYKDAELEATSPFGDLFQQVKLPTTNCLVASCDWLVMSSTL